MAAITDYATLQTSLADWAERSDYDFDEIVGLAEAEFRLYLGPHFSKETSTTLTFTSGSATLPTGLVRVISLVHSTYGALTEQSAGGVREQRVWDTSGIPSIYAVQGTTVITAASYTGDLTLDYEGTLTGLSSGNPTNWLITYAPQAYLAMCKSFVAARGEDYAGAATLKAAAMGTLSELGIQSMVMQLGRAAVRIPGTTP
jgi:hypothetical protein